MNSIRSNNLDYIWMMIVLIHVIGATATGIIMLIPFGIVMANTFFWLYVAYGNRTEKMGIALSGIAWSILMYAFVQIPGGYRSSLLMNLFILFYVLYLHYGNVPFLLKENQIHLFRGIELIYIFPLLILLRLIGTFFNSLSMMVFQNHVVATLDGISDHLWGGLLVFALAPAIVEELVFRGMFMKKLGRGWKAIFISALLFALCHMNFNQICYAFILGLIFAFIFSMTGNLLMTITIHFLFNAYTVISSAYAEHSLVKALSGFQIAGYYPLGDSFYGLSGGSLYQAIGVGTVVAAFSSFLLIFLLRSLTKEGKMWRESREQVWKAGPGFYVGIVICILIASLLQ